MNAALVNAFIACVSLPQPVPPGFERCPDIVRAFHAEADGTMNELQLHQSYEDGLDALRHK